jgi:cytoskeleton protein RodZ
LAPVDTLVDGMDPGVVTPPVTGPDSIILNVTADSWIEIIDAKDQRVYVDLARTGDVLYLSGYAPFQVLLGFAQGVTIQYNGNPFDQSPYSRSGVARFTLGE